MSSARVAETVRSEEFDSLYAQLRLNRVQPHGSVPRLTGRSGTRGSTGVKSEPRLGGIAARPYRADLRSRRREPGAPAHGVQ